MNLESKTITNEKAIRALVKSNIETFAQTFSERHIADIDNPNGTINMKIHNVFIAILGEEIQYYTALVRSLDSSLGNMLEGLAINIAGLFYKVETKVTGPLYPEQTSKIAELLEAYKNICMGKERIKNPKHPTQKPISVLKHIIKIASNENDIVFDPFMGVGSTGIASLQEKRRFVGFEIDEKYHQATLKRIKEQV